MSEWNTAQEASFQELVLRAKEQSRAYYERREQPLCLPTSIVTYQPQPPPQSKPQPTQKSHPRPNPHPAPQCPNSGVTPPSQRPNSGVTPPRPNPAPQCPSSGVTPPPQCPASGGTPPSPPHPYPASQRPASGGTPPPPPPLQLDNEGLMLATLLWLLIEEKADMKIIMALGYILLV